MNLKTFTSTEVASKNIIKTSIFSVKQLFWVICYVVPKSVCFAWCSLFCEFLCDSRLYKEMSTSVLFCCLFLCSRTLFTRVCFLSDVLKGTPNLVKISRRGATVISLGARAFFVGACFLFLFPPQSACSSQFLSIGVTVWRDSRDLFPIIRLFFRRPLWLTGLMHSLFLHQMYLLLSF